MKTGITGRILQAIASEGWWTPEEIAIKTGDILDDIDGGIKELLATGVIARRHLGSNRRGDMFAYRVNVAFKP